jgi:DNA polymerase III subunit chi
MVTRVRFYHNAENPLALACELTARAYASGRRVALRVPDADTARRLDQLLWSFDQLAFVPHVMSGARLASETPVLLGLSHESGNWAHNDLLFNLADDVPADFGQFRMLIEVVGQIDSARAPARSRWTYYKSAGLAIEAFDAVHREAL